MRVIIQNDRSVGRRPALTDNMRDGWTHLVHMLHGMLSGETNAMINIPEASLSSLTSGQTHIVNDARIRADTVILADAKSDLSNYTITTADGAITFTRA